MRSQFGMPEIRETLSRRKFLALSGAASLAVLGGGLALGRGPVPSGAALARAEEGAGSRTFTDSAGREVTLTGIPTCIAALRGSSYDKCLFFGKSKEVAIAATSKAWAKKVFPDFDPIVADDPQNPNIEDLVSMGVDLTLFWNTPDVIQSLEDAGIPVVVGSDEKNKTIKSVDDFRTWMKDDIQIYGNAIDAEAGVAKAQEWCEYFDNAIEMVTERTSQLSADEIPDVYYIRGPEVTSTHAAKSITIWYVRAAGGRLVTEDIDEKIATVDAEQINAWDPDIIFMGRLKSTDDILNNPDFSEVKAVKNNMVMLNPCGVYEWDYGTEGALFVQWLAKTMHPELFEDLDMVEEVKSYYKRFYDYDLDDEGANLILSNQDPA